MLCGTAAASHTFKDKGYTYKMPTKEETKIKKVAKKKGTSYVHHKVSKKKRIDSIEKLKIGKTYRFNGGKTYKILKLVKTYKGSKYGGGGYNYLVQDFAKMNCRITYMNNNFVYHATTYFPAPGY